MSCITEAESKAQSVWDSIITVRIRASIKEESAMEGSLVFKNKRLKRRGELGFLLVQETLGDAGKAASGFAGLFS